MIGLAAQNDLTISIEGVLPFQKRRDAFMRPLMIQTQAMPPYDQCYLFFKLFK
jgi:hypothetical protein